MITYRRESQQAHLTCTLWCRLRRLSCRITSYYFHQRIAIDLITETRGFYIIQVLFLHVPGKTTESVRVVA